MKGQIMQFCWTPREIAVIAALAALDRARMSLEVTLKDCGELSSKDAKQSDANKEYFAEQASAYKAAISLLPRIREAIFAFDESEIKTPVAAKE